MDAYVQPLTTLFGSTDTTLRNRALKALHSLADSGSFELDNVSVPYFAKCIFQPSLLPCDKDRALDVRIEQHEVDAALQPLTTEELCMVVCLFAIAKLQRCPTTDADDLEFDQNSLHQALAYIVYSSITPTLPDGVGVVRQVPEVAVAASLPDHPLFDMQSITLFLLGCMEAKVLRSAIITRHLTDLYAALCSIIHFTTDPESRKTWNKRLFALGKSLHPALIMDALMMLKHAAAPPWLVTMIVTMLSTAMMRPLGIQSLILRMTEAVDEDISQKDHQTFYRAAVHVAACPRSMSSVAKYYQLIAPQLLKMLRSKRTGNGSKLVFAAIKIIVVMLQKNPIETKEQILQPLWKPFYCFYMPEKELLKLFSAEVGSDDFGRVIVDEHDLACSVEDTHRLVVSEEPTPTLTSLIGRLVPDFFRLYCFCKKRGALNLGAACQEIIMTFLRRAEQTEAQDCVMGIVTPFTVAKASGSLAKLTFAAGSEGGVCVRLLDQHTPDESAVDAEALVDIVGRVPRVASWLFLHLLREYSRMKGEPLPLDWQSRYDQRMLLQTLLSMGTSLGSTVLKMAHETAQFMAILLENDDASDPEFLLMCFGLLSSLMHELGTSQVTDQLVKRVQDLAKRGDLPAEVREMAGELAAQLISVKLASHAEEASSPVPASSIASPLISLAQAMSDLRDPLLPVRAAGLRQLRQMVLMRHQEILGHLDELLGIFESQLTQEDSFLYGSAILGLAALCDVYADVMIEPICKWYVAGDCASLDDNYRTRVGECLFKTASRCGETLPYRMPVLLHTFLCGVKDKSPAVRCSALVNLSACCELAPHAVAPCFYEIYRGVSAILKFDEEAEVRRGAVLVLHGFALGFGWILVTEYGELFQELKDTLLIAAQTNSDITVVGHCQTALDYLDDIVKSLIQSQ